MDEWPLPIPGGWVEHVNRVQTAAALAAVRRSLVRGVPFGDATWQVNSALLLGLETTLRPRARPRKISPEKRK